LHYKAFCIAKIDQSNSNINSQMETLRLSQGGTIQLYRNYLQNNSTLFTQLKTTIPWKRSNVTVYGKTYKTPRFQAWMGNKDIDANVYSLDNRIDWIPEIEELVARLESLLNTTFNYVLLNYYETGQDYISYHADNEVLDDDDFIASLSLGGSRRFLVRPKPSKSEEKYEWVVNDGDLIVMDGKMQRSYKHSVPKTTKPVEGRINLTFRKAKVKM